MKVVLRKKHNKNFAPKQWLMNRRLMNFSKIFMLRNNFKYIAWFFWSIFLINALTCFYPPFIASEENIQKFAHVNILFISLTIVASIEAAATLFIR